MWVLDARYKAEKVWYSLIWEKAKEDPNVIDYNINEEITKDTSAVLNANNDTTTGMATVIPWVNAPKIIAETSIAGWEGWISLNDILVKSTSDTEWAQKLLDNVIAWKTAAAFYKIGSSAFRVVHLSWVGLSQWYIRFYRVEDTSNYLIINFNTTTRKVTSIDTNL